MNMFRRLPYFVFLDNKKYKINVDFRKMISFEKKIQDKSVSKAEKIKYGITQFYPFFYKDINFYYLIQNPKLYKEACDKLVWFYKCGREDYLAKKSESKGTPLNQVFSYEYDDEAIFSAFYRMGIDLTKDKVHWWKFKALLKNLLDEEPFEKIKSYRAYTGEDKKIRELKEYYQLPLPESEQKRLDALYESLK